MRRRTTYTVRKDGEWFPVRKRGYKIACCDCGLVHRVDFSIRRGTILMRAFRDARATAAKRRANGARKEP